MIRKTFVLFILATIAFVFTTFNATNTSAQMGTSLVTAIPELTPQPTHMPYSQQLLYGSQQKFTNPFSELMSGTGPIRGVYGDWWADVVIGQPSFGQITPNEVVGKKLFNPG